MANRLNIQSTLTIDDGATYQLVNKQGQITNLSQVGTRYGGGVQVIPAAAGGTAIAIPAGVSTAGWGWVRNNDATNYVEIGVQVGGTFYPVIRLYPGHSHPVSFATLTLYALANTASVPLEFLMSEH